ncbi:MAG: T9SS type A sorting domain-containing protein [Bacteroidota bacterium]
MRNIQKHIVIILIINLFTFNLYSQYWNFSVGDTLSDYYGYNSIPTIKALLVHDTVLYVAGDVTSAGSLQCDNLLKWNGTNWSTVSSGGSGAGSIYCIETYANQLYRGGGDYNIGGISGLEKIARHNNTNWTWLINNVVPNYAVYCMKEYNSKLYFGGQFLQIGPSTINGVASWDGSNFDRIFERTFWGYAIRSMEVFNGELYFGGNTLGIINIGGDTINHMGIYRYDGTTCYDVGEADLYTVWALVTDTFNNFLYVAGDFATTVPSCPYGLYRIAKWDGYKWYNLLEGTNDGISELEVYRGELYAGGAFTQAGGKICEYMARWNGEEWFPLDTNVIAWGGPMDVFNDELYVGGAFVTLIDTVYGIGRWFMPDTSCSYLQPLVHSLKNGALQDTFYLVNDTVTVQFYNNNAYVDSWSWDFGDSGADTIKDPSYIYTDTGVYNVELVVSHGSCIDTASKTVTVLLGTGININKIDEETGFKLYPNPTSGILYIEFLFSFTQSLKGDSLEIQIVDTKGKVVLNNKVMLRNSKYDIDISGLPNGVYFVKIGEQAAKFVKE